MNFSLELMDCKVLKLHSDKYLQIYDSISLENIKIWNKIGPKNNNDITYELKSLCKEIDKSNNCEFKYIKFMEFCDTVLNNKNFITYQNNFRNSIISKCNSIIEEKQIFSVNHIECKKAAYFTILVLNKIEKLIKNIDK